MEVSMTNVIVTWIGFGLHLCYILLAAWWHKKIGGVGMYGGGAAYGMDEVEEGYGEPEMQQDHGGHPGYPG